VSLNSTTTIKPYASVGYKYLGVTLDRLLVYCPHLESLHKKLTSCLALFRRLAGSGWGAGATTLHPSLGVFQPQSTVLLSGAHTRLIDPIINNALQIVTGRSSAGIQPAELHRNEATRPLAHHDMEPRHTCSTQRSPVHRAQRHNASNRDSHL